MLEDGAGAEGGLEELAVAPCVPHAGGGGRGEDVGEEVEGDELGGGGVVFFGYGCCGVIVVVGGGAFGERVSVFGGFVLGVRAAEVVGREHVLGDHLNDFVGACAGVLDREGGDARDVAFAEFGVGGGQAGEEVREFCFSQGVEVGGAVVVGVRGIGWGGAAVVLEVAAAAFVSGVVVVVRGVVVAVGDEFGDVRCVFELQAQVWRCPCCATFEQRLGWHERSLSACSISS